MAQLDTRGFMSGAMQGFGLMDRYKDNTRRREREDEQLDAWREDRQIAQKDRTRNIGRQDRADAQASDMHQRQTRQLDRTEAQQRLRGVYTNLQTGGSLADEDWSAVGEIHNQFPGLVPTDLREGYNSRRMETGMAEIRNLINNPAGISEAELDDLDSMPIPLSRAVSPQNGEALAVADDLMNPETDTNLRSPEVLWAVNQLWGPRIGDGKQITSIVPGKEPGTLAFSVSVDDGQGGTQEQPITRGRGTADDGDNEVLQIPVDQMMDELADAKALYQSFEANPEARNRILQHGVGMGIIDAPAQAERGYGEMINHPQLGLGQMSPEGKWTPAEGGAGAANSGSGRSAGSLTESQWGTMQNRNRQAAFDRYNIEWDPDTGRILSGSENAQEANAYASIMDIVQRQASEQLGYVPSASELAVKLDRAVGGRVMRPEQAVEFAREDMGPEASESDVQAHALEMLNNQYNQVMQDVLGEYNLLPGQNEQGSGQPSQQPPGNDDLDPETRSVLDMALGGGEQPQNGTGMGVMAGEGPTGPQGLGLNQPEQRAASRESAPQPEPQQPQGDGLQAPQSIRERPESDAETPLGRTIDNAFTGANNALDVVDDKTRGWVTGLFGLPNRQASDLRDSAKWTKYKDEVIERIGGGSFRQQIRPQSDFEVQMNNKINQFIRSREAQDLLGSSEVMRDLFEHDPEGFIAGIEQGKRGEELRQWLAESGRTPQGLQQSPFPNVQ